MSFGDQNRTTDPDDRVATEKSVLRGILYALLNGTAISGPVSTKELRSSTGTQTSVVSSASTGLILAANANRLGVTIFNDSTAVLYLVLSNVNASVTAYTVQVGGNGYYEVPFGYTGIINGIWSSATGNARVTEFT